MADDIVCPECHGEGKLEDGTQCDMCEGFGWVPEWWPEQRTRLWEQ